MTDGIEKAFQGTLFTPDRKALVCFLTAGDPDADSTVAFALAMERA